MTKMNDLTTQSGGVCVWLHGDGLSPNDAALRAYPDAPAIFVFDEELLRGEYRLSFKRLFFIYECVVDLFDRIGNPVKELRRGRVPEEVMAFCREHGLTRIAVTETYAPRFQTFLAEFKRAGFHIETFAKPKLAHYDGVPKRFMSFWKKIERAAFQD